MSRGIFFRWIMENQSYQFEVRHRAGRLIPHVDGLSRSSHLPPPDKEEEEEQDEYVQSLHAAGYIAEIEEALCPEGLLGAQRNDENLKHVFAWKAEGKKMTKAELREIADKELRTYAHHLDSIEEKEGTLYQKYISNRPMDRQKLRAIIPEELRDQVFYFSHIHPAAGHFGHRGTSTRAAQRFLVAWHGSRAA